MRRFTAAAIFIAATLTALVAAPAAGALAGGGVSPHVSCCQPH